MALKGWSSGRNAKPSRCKKSTAKAWAREEGGNVRTESLWRSTLPPATRYRGTPAAHGAAVRTRWAAAGPHRPGGGAPGVERGDYGHLWAPSPCERPRWLLQNSSSTADAGPAGSPAALGLECRAGSRDLLRNGTAAGLYCCGLRALKKSYITDGCPGERGDVQAAFR